jgi:hypothetical protein
MGVRFHASSQSCWARRCPSLSRERLGEANKHTYLELREAGASRFRSEMRAGMSPYSIAADHRSRAGRDRAPSRRSRASLRPLGPSAPRTGSPKRRLLHAR